MFRKIVHFVHRSMSSLYARFRNGIKTRDALVLSLLLHVIAAAAMASFYAGTVMINKTSSSEDIVLEFVGETTPTALSHWQTDAKQSSADNRALAEKQESNRHWALSSSLASLSNLKNSFSFVKHTVSSDSTYGLAPVSGRGPNTDAIAQGFENGRGNGRGVQISVGGGGGVCVPGPGR